MLSDLTTASLFTVLVAKLVLPYQNVHFVGTYMPYGYNSSSGEVVGNPAGNKGDCLECLAGNFCLNSTVLPYPCGTGKYTNPGQSVCQTCLAGHYCDSGTTTETAMNTTKQCPAGKYCTTGLKNVSEATDCSKAHYCPQGLWLVHCIIKISSSRRGSLLGV